jgi:hypothetical protein
MDRGSDRHGPVQDEALRQEIEELERGGGSSRAEDWRDPEPSGEDQPRASLDPEGTSIGGTPPGMDAADVAGRTELAQSLTGLHYPVTGAQVKSAAADQQVPDHIRAEVQALPDDATYESLSQVWSALGHGTEAHRT